ncbi:helix-turn-helix transcriptional regulator [bacterium]|nr:helix-turn-helix transcriptional regulator [bacterium]
MYKNDLKSIGRNIKAERVRKDYSQEELAELANTTRRSISMIESGLQNPKLTLVIDIANSLNIDLNKLFE